MASLCLKLKLKLQLDKIVLDLSIANNVINIQTFVNCLYLFGDLQQIRSYHIFEQNPSEQIIIMMVSQVAIGKICYLQTKKIDELLIHRININIAMLGRLQLMKLSISRDPKNIPFKYIISSGDVAMIRDYINENESVDCLSTIKELIATKI